MLRMTLVVVLLLFGTAQALRGPFYALLFYLFYAYFRPEYWVWNDLLVGANISLAIGVWAVGYTFVSAHERIARTWPAFLVLAFLLHGLASTLLSEYFEWSIRWWYMYAKVAAITILIMSLVTTLERFRLTIVVIALALAYDGVKQGWFYLTVSPGDQNLNGLEILGDNNGVAVGMLMLSALLLPMMQTSKPTWQKGFWAFMLLGSIFRALSTYSRGGFLAFAGMTVVYWTRSKHKIRTALLVGTVAVGLLSVMPEQFWDRMSTILADEGERDFSQESRLFFWRVAASMANDHPFFGVGHTAFQPAYNRYDPTGGLFGRSRAVHSSWFGVLAEQGYVGLGLFVLILGLAFLAAGRARKRAKGRPEHEALFMFAGGMQAALVAGAVGGTFLSYHYVEIMWHFIGLAFALERVAAHEIGADAPPAETLEAERPAPVFVTVNPEFRGRAAALSRR